MKKISTIIINNHTITMDPEVEMECLINQLFWLIGLRGMLAIQRGAIYSSYWDLPYGSIPHFIETQECEECTELAYQLMVLDERIEYVDEVRDNFQRQLEDEVEELSHCRLCGELLTEKELKDIRLSGSCNACSDDILYYEQDRFEKK